MFERATRLMQHIAANRHRQTLKPSEMAADGQGIEQGLRGVFMLAVAGVQHGAGHLLRQQFDCT